VKAAEGAALELQDGAFELLESDGIRRLRHRPAGRGASPGLRHGARRPARGQRRDLRSTG
jgi:hypothetical protein